MSPYKEIYPGIYRNRETFDVAPPRIDDLTRGARIGWLSKHFNLFKPDTEMCKEYWGSQTHPDIIKRLAEHSSSNCGKATVPPPFALWYGVESSLDIDVQMCRIQSDMGNKLHMLVLTFTEVLQNCVRDGKFNYRLTASGVVGWLAAKGYTVRNVSRFETLLTPSRMFADMPTTTTTILAKYDRGD